MDKLFSRVLIIGFVWPEPASSAAGSRMMQLISFFRDHNCRITFASTSKKNEFTYDLLSEGIECVSIKVNDPQFDEFVRDLSPDLVLFDRFMTEEQFGWRVHEHCPTAIRILDTEDLHCLRHARYKSLKKNESRYENYLASDIAKREIASIYRSDLSLIISEFEMKVLQEYFHVPTNILNYLPYMLDSITEENIDQWPGFEQRQGFMTIGNFLHKPNLDAVKFLKTDLWPLIREKLPNARMHVYGAYQNQMVEEWHKPSEGFLIHGRVDDASKVMKEARVCLAPLRFGAGLKGKLVEAMLTGTPSVASTVGAEGIPGELDWPGFIADSPRDFADAAIMLHSDKSVWEESVRKGETIINRRFSKESLEEKLNQRLTQVADEITDHRSRNFTGSMLMHHTMTSTRYMSKWIEEKNNKSNN